MIRLGGEICIDEASLDVRAVRANIERLHAQRPEDAVVVAADKGAHTGVLVQVIDQVRQGGVQNVSHRGRRARRSLESQQMQSKQSQRRNRRNRHRPRARCSTSC